MKPTSVIRSLTRAAIPPPLPPANHRPTRRIFSYCRLAALILCLATGLAAPSLVAAAGVWSPLAHQAPSTVGLMLLLPDGTVMCQSGNDAATTGWYKLTPDANGHYINGTWSTLASMHYARLFYQSQVLPDGRLFVSGGEYGTGHTNCETYDPLSNIWTQQPSVGKDLSDAGAETLPNGNVIVSTFSGGTPCLIYDIVANTWSQGPTVITGQDEAPWVKLSDGSTLTVDGYSTNCERYIPSLNRWIADNPAPTPLYGKGAEIGAAYLLPNGKAFFIGGTNHTAIYTPSGGTNVGAWVAGADMPYNANEGTTLGAVDAPSAMLFNGKILCALGTVTNWGSTTYFYEYDYTANTFTQVGSPSGGTGLAATPYNTQMLDLPDGTVLFSYGNAQVYSYEPDGSPVTNGIPTIKNVIANYDGSYTIFGTLLNGISQGAAYGDDKQMDTGRPIAYLTNSAGNIQFCRTYNWSTCNTATGTNVLSTSMTLPSGLANGTYPLVVSANGISSAPFSFTVSGSVTRPPAPTGLTATGGADVINLSWTQSTGAGIAYNRIYRSANGSGGPYTLLVTIPATTAFADTTAVAGNTYYYEVSAIDATAESAPSASAGATATRDPSLPYEAENAVLSGPIVGNAYAGYSGTGYADYQNASNDYIEWTVNMASAGAYPLVFRYANGGTGDRPLELKVNGVVVNSSLSFPVTGAWSTWANVSNNATLNAGNNTVRLTAIGYSGGNVDYLGVVVTGGGSVPPSPTALGATGGNAVVNLAWTQSTGTGLTGNNVYRSTTGSGGPYNLLANLTASTSYSDTAVVNGSTYFYTVTAVNTNGESAQSAYAGATTIPAVPTGLSATAGNNQVALSWTAASGATSYNVKRATVSGGPYTTIASPTGASYTDTTAVNGTTYYYVVSAVNTAGESANSSQVSATPSAPALPAAPTGLTATAQQQHGKIKLSWTQSTSGNITNNKVYRSTTNGGPYSLVATLSTTTSYADSGLTSGTTYYYVVTAVNSGGESANSNQANATSR